MEMFYVGCDRLNDPCCLRSSNSLWGAFPLGALDPLAWPGHSLPRPLGRPPAPAAPPAQRAVVPPQLEPAGARILVVAAVAEHAVRAEDADVEVLARRLLAVLVPRPGAAAGEAHAAAARAAREDSRRFLRAGVSERAPDTARRWRAPRSAHIYR